MVILTAYILDSILGDPEKWPHPVRFIGALISYLDKKLNIREIKSPVKLVYRGALLTALVIMITVLLVVSIQLLLSSIHWILGNLFYAYLAYTTLAVKNLSQAAMQIYSYLEAGDIDSARYSLSMIVGRDTNNLSESEITRAAIETVAENFSDGVIAPIVYLFLGGPMLAILYKAINTMDSMIGYRNQKYLYFGRCAARLDDVANWIPARASVFFLMIAVLYKKFNIKNVWKIMIRDRNNHSSPNAGYPEATVAGALEVQLGGASTYFGVKSTKPLIGDSAHSLDKKKIPQAVQLMQTASLVSVVILSIIHILIGGIRWNMAGIL
ncbi:MAG: cobalamin biosynthesis protein CobD [Tindallia sp. MSAO_Bac2]|nr:MAG: cobalamin biosynthesis protein CobD [Tindallia sp. MSAO_Bac2]